MIPHTVSFYLFLNAKIFLLLGIFALVIKCVQKCWIDLCAQLRKLQCRRFKYTRSQHLESK